MIIDQHTIKTLRTLAQQCDEAKNQAGVHPAMLLALLDAHQLMENKLYQVGVCPKCLTVPVKYPEKLLSSCNCGMQEDHAKRPLQKLQLVEAAIKDLLIGRQMESGRRTKNGLLSQKTELEYCRDKGRQLMSIL